MSVQKRSVTRGSVRYVLGLLGVSLLASSISAQTTAPQAYPRPKALPVEERLAMLITLQDVVKIPDRVIGREANVIGIVTDVIGPRLFVVRGKGAIVDSRVPVIAKEPITALYGRPNSAPVQVGDELQIIGKVTRFAAPETQSLIGGPIESSFARRFTGKPALITDFVVVWPAAGASAEETRKEVDTSSGAVWLQIPDRPSMVGRRVRMMNMTVGALVSDRCFWISTGTDPRMFAVLRPSLDRGVMEEIVKIKPGQLLTLRGLLLPMPDRTEIPVRWTVIDKQEVEALAKEPVYLYVSSITFHDRVPSPSTIGS